MKQKLSIITNLITQKSNLSIIRQMFVLYVQNTENSGKSLEDILTVKVAQNAQEIF